MQVISFLKSIILSSVRSYSASACSTPSHKTPNLDAEKKREMGLKVFGPPKFTNVARVLVCLEEVGAEYQVVPIDYAAGQHKSPRITRNSRYILRKYKSDLLREDNLKEAALVDAWLDVEYGQYSVSCSPIIYNVIVKPMNGEVVDQQVVDTNLEKLKKVLDVYKARLSQCKYLAGDVISFADLSHFPSTYYIMSTEYGSVFDSYPHVKAWWETITARPSIRKVIEIISA